MNRKKKAIIFSSVALLVAGILFWLIDLKDNEDGALSDQIFDDDFFFAEGEEIPSPLRVRAANRPQIIDLRIGGTGPVVTGITNEVPEELPVKAVYNFGSHSDTDPRAPAVNLLGSTFARNSNSGLPAWYFSGGPTGPGSGLPASSYVAMDQENPGDENKPDTDAPKIDDPPILWDNPRAEVSPVPEPTTILLVGAGLLGVAGAGKRCRKRKPPSSTLVKIGPALRTRMEIAETPMVNRTL